jgi:hypothetical protein
MKSDKFTDNELEAAYKICILIKFHSDNVLASGENSKSDREWSRDAGKFIKAYERVFATNAAKRGQAGFMGEALLKLQSMQETIKNIDKVIEP